MAQLSNLLVAGASRFLSKIYCTEIFSEESIESNKIISTNFSGNFSGNGSNLTNLNASNLSTGIIPVSRLPVVSRSNTASTITPSFSGTFSVIDSVTTDSYGRVTAINTKTVTIPANPNTDTKNTAGSTNSSSKLFLIGATSQATNPVTYSHDTAYIGADGSLYSANKKTSVEGHSHEILNINGEAYNGTAKKDISLLPFIMGTQTTATGLWTGNAPTINALYNGLSIRYWLPFNGSGNASLNLTLANGTQTGNVACYWKGTYRLTTHYQAGVVITLTYMSNVQISGAGSYTGWWADADYYADTYDRIRLYSSIKAKNAIAANRLITGDKDGYSMLAANNTFDISYPILYTINAITSGSTATGNYYTAYPNMAIKDTFSFSFSAYSAIYIKGTLSGTKFTPNATVLTDVVPTTADNYVYMLLGYSHSTTAVYILNEHPMYRFRYGQFQRISGDDSDYIDSDGSLRSNGKKVSTEGHTHGSTVSTTLSVTGWSASAPFTQTKAVTGITAADVAVIGNKIADGTTPANVKLQKKAWGCVDRVTSNAGSVTFYCYNKKPEADFSVSIKI